MCKYAIRWLCAIALLVSAGTARATFHLWQLNEIYSNADGTVQFIEFSTGVSGQQFLIGHTVTSSQGATTRSFTFPSDLPGDSAGRTFLIGTTGFAALGLVTPDYIVPNGFLFTTNGSVNFAGVDSDSWTALPVDGAMSIDRFGAMAINSPKNFAGATGSVFVSSSPTFALENPQPGSFQSGIGLISGWSCQGSTIGVSIDGGAQIPQLLVPYGSSRPDTASVCGASNTYTGFGLLINFNLLGNGTHTAQALVNGVPQGTPTQFTVTVPSVEFLTGVSSQVSVPNFPSAGRTTTLMWQQSQQNFVIMSVSNDQSSPYFPYLAGATGNVFASSSPIFSLENPQPGSFQSGIGLISGWSCQGSSIGVSIDGGAQIPPILVPYGSSRPDTASVCGASNTYTGFGVLINFNLLGNGTHTAQALVNGVPQGTPTQFTVTVPSVEFLTGVSSQVAVPNFPSAGRTTTLMWQQSQQNFVIMSATP